MSEKLSSDALKYIIARLIANANEAIDESRADRGDLFKSGRSLAYFEMLDILQAELDAREQDLREFGLNVDLMQKYI